MPPWPSAQHVYLPQIPSSNKMSSVSKKGKERKVCAEIKLHVKHNAAWGTCYPHFQQLKGRGTPRISSASSLKEVFLAPHRSHLGDVSMVLFLSSIVFLLSENHLEKTTHDASPGPGLSLGPPPLSWSSALHVPALSGTMKTGYGTFPPKLTQ